VKPRVGFFLMPIVTPFLAWLPKIPAPGINPLNAMLGAVFVLWALRRVIERRSVLRLGRLTGPLALITVICGLGLVRGSAFPSGYTYDTIQSSIQLFRALVTFTVYFIAFSMAEGEKDRRRMAGAIVIALLLESVATIILGRTGSGSRAVGSFGQANDLGAFLSLHVPIAAALWFGVKKMWAKIGIAAAVLAGCVATVFTLSRASIVALGLTLGVVAVRRSRALTMLLVSVALLSPFWAPQWLKDRVLGNPDAAEFQSDVELDHAAQLRVDTWRAIGQLITEHPVDGVGFAGLEYVLPETGENMGLEVKDSSHNTYLRFLSEMGILGLLAFIVLLFKCFSLARAGVAAAGSEFDRNLAFGMGVATLALAVNCAFGDRFFNVLIIGNFWITCALVDDIIRERKERA
jgi:O-antigen ligase